MEVVHPIKPRLALEEVLDRSAEIRAAEWRVQLSQKEDLPRRLHNARSAVDLGNGTDNLLLAGLCLHEEGSLSWDDVELLQATANEKEGFLGAMGRNPRLLDLAKRIAALLPDRK